MALRDQSCRLLAVGHELSGTGAPTSLLAILRFLRKTTRWDIRVLAVRGGPLHAAYAEQAPVWTYLLGRKPIAAAAANSVASRLSPSSPWLA